VVTPIRGRLASTYALFLLALVALTGCGSTQTSHWRGVPTVSGAPSAPGGASGAPSVSGDPGDDGGTSSSSRSPSPPASPTGGASFQGRLPSFPPPPSPQPIKAPGGPYAPIYKRLPVNQPVAFLTMDDGWTQLPVASQLMQAAHVPFTMFLIGPVAARNPGFFEKLEAQGGVVENHTLTHSEMRGKPYDFQRHEVCGAKASLEQTFGTTLSFFRPPFGDYDQTTLKVVRDCGLKAAFYWSETVNNGKVFYQTAEHRIHRGDIILMHFRPRFVDDVIAALTAIHDAGLTPALLENYVT
jgi:peptidoglycan/xylan/chitin deacetylase (PgdA/CDA1 family)